MESFLTTLLFKLRGLDSYPGGTCTHCSCQPSLDAPFAGSNPTSCAEPSVDVRIEGGSVGGMDTAGLGSVISQILRIETWDWNVECWQAPTSYGCISSAYRFKR
jgi:hypothetical protein